MHTGQPVILSHGVTGDDVASQESWQALFDGVIDDWHKDGIMKSCVRMIAQPCVTPTAYSQCEAIGIIDAEINRPGNEANIAGGAMNTITLAVNTHTMNHKHWGMWTEKGPVGGKRQNQKGTDQSCSKRASTENLDIDEDQKEAGKLVILDKIGADWSYGQLRRYLCERFGICVVLEYVPCDINGNPKK